MAKLRQETTGVFASEAHLVELFAQKVFAFDDLNIRLLGREFNYVGGRIDVICKNTCGELLAFEAKLSRWRGAVTQAYRNTSLAHYSYVVVPEAAATTAKQYSGEFGRRGIGLCSITHHGAIQVEIAAPKNVPLQHWLTESALCTLR